MGIHGGGDFLFLMFLLKRICMKRGVMGGVVSTIARLVVARIFLAAAVKTAVTHVQCGRCIKRHFAGCAGV